MLIRTSIFFGRPRPPAAPLGAPSFKKKDAEAIRISEPEDRDTASPPPPGAREPEPKLRARAPKS